MFQDSKINSINHYDFLTYLINIYKAKFKRFPFLKSKR